MGNNPIFLSNGEMVWKANRGILRGVLHREDGPAKIGPNWQEWYFDGKHHRIDGPAEILFIPNRQPSFVANNSSMIDAMAFSHHGVSLSYCFKSGRLWTMEQIDELENLTKQYHVLFERSMKEGWTDGIQAGNAKIKQRREEIYADVYDQLTPELIEEINNLRANPDELFKTYMLEFRKYWTEEARQHHLDWAMPLWQDLVAGGVANVFTSEECRNKANDSDPDRWNWKKNYDHLKRWKTFDPYAIMGFCVEDLSDGGKRYQFFGYIRAEWRNNKDQLHRTDGPAIQDADGYEEFWIDGVKKENVK